MPNAHEYLSENDVARARAIAAQAPPPSREVVGHVVSIMEAAVRGRVVRDRQEAQGMRAAIEEHREDALSDHLAYMPGVVEQRDAQLWKAIGLDA